MLDGPQASQIKKKKVKIIPMILETKMVGRAFEPHLFP